MNVSFTNNEVTSAGTSLVFSSYVDSSINAEVTNNMLSTNLWSGMRLGNSGNGSVQVIFTENTVNAIRNGIYFSPSFTLPIVLDGYDNNINFGSGYEAVESLYSSTAVVNNLMYP